MTDATAPAPTTVEVHSGSVLPESLASEAEPARIGLWRVERDLWSPETHVLLDSDGAVRGAALTAGRAHCAYRKVVDVIAADDAVWGRLVASVQADARPASGSSRAAPVAVHVEEHLAVAPLTPARRDRLESLAFERAARPLPSVPSTRPGDPGQTNGWTWWSRERPTRLAHYYGQTTDVTCGAVAALMGLGLHGHEGFDPASLEANRATEIAFWRQATNLPAIEPIALALELARAGEGLIGSLPRVVLSAETPVLLEEYEPGHWEHALRLDLQQESLRQARAAGIPIERRWIEVAEIAERVRAGAQALLLIDLTDLIDDPTPHWVLATDIVDETLIISDPWVQAANGETWLDTYALPLPLASVERVTRWGAPSYRGVIFLGER